MNVQSILLPTVIPSGYDISMIICKFVAQIAYGKFYRLSVIKALSIFVEGIQEFNT
jgi:hypothetical protein